MRKLSIAICCVLLFVSTASAFEKGDKYGGLDYMFFDYQCKGSSGADITALRARMGYYLSPHFAIEGLVGIGVNDDSYMGYIDNFGVGSLVEFEVELDSLIGIYFRGELLAKDIIKFYCVIGVSKIELTSSSFNYDESDDETDLSIGIGLEIKLIKNVGINVEYMSLMEKDDYDITTTSLGCKLYF